MEFGRYQTLCLLGQGGMAKVYLAEDPVLRRMVALKVITPQAFLNPIAKARFATEGQAVASVQDRNVVQVFDFGVRGEEPYLVMEYVDGYSLEQALAANGNKPLPTTVCAAIVAQAAEGLAAAHGKGIVHRDIKPGNLLINAEGVLKVADFGIAHMVDQNTLTQTGAVVGSPNYMAPEQAEGRQANAKTDLFALGGVLYSCLTGQLPFRAANVPATFYRICHTPHQPIPELNPDADPNLCWIADTLLQKDPEKRDWTALLLADFLNGFLRDMYVPRSSSALKLHFGWMAESMQMTLAEGHPGRKPLSSQAVKPATPRQEAPQTIAATSTRPSPRRGEVSGGNAPDKPARKRLLAPSLLLGVTAIGIIGAVAWKERFSGSSHQTSAGARSVPAGFVAVPAGCFAMGSGRGYKAELPVHEVCLDGYHIQAHEVTVAEYQECVRAGKCRESSSHGPQDNLPVTGISWHDAAAYCAWKGLRLPTEAEWEYAARSGKDNLDPALGSDNGWFAANSGGRLHAVGLKIPNSLGLFDMLGNASEWCSDWHGEDFYGTSPRENPQGPSVGRWKAARGGAYGSASGDIRITARFKHDPETRIPTLGFRTVFPARP